VSGDWFVESTDDGDYAWENLHLTVDEGGTIHGGPSTLNGQTRTSAGHDAGDFQVGGKICTETGRLTFTQTYGDGAVTNWEATYSHATDTIADGVWSGSSEGTFKGCRLDCGLARGDHSRRLSAQTCSAAKSGVCEGYERMAKAFLTMENVQGATAAVQNGLHIEPMHHGLRKLQDECVVAEQQCPSVTDAQKMPGCVAKKPDSERKPSGPKLNRGDRLPGGGRPVPLPADAGQGCDAKKPNSERCRAQQRARQILLAQNARVEGHMCVVIDEFAAAVILAFDDDNDRRLNMGEFREFLKVIRYSKSLTKSQWKKECSILDAQTSGLYASDIATLYRNFRSHKLCTDLRALCKWSEHIRDALSTNAPSQISDARCSGSNPVQLRPMHANLSASQPASAGPKQKRTRRTRQRENASVGVAPMAVDNDEPPWHNQLQHLIDLTGMSVNDAAHFLESAEGKVQIAASLYFDQQQDLNVSPVHSSNPATQACGRNEIGDGAKRSQHIQSLPEHWTAMASEHTPTRVDVEAASDEMTLVRDRFCQTCSKESGFEILKVQRIQHARRWRQFQVEKQGMDAREDGTGANEQLLWHGTAKNNVPFIIANGFDRSYTKTAAYGHGVYFARDAFYSSERRFATPDPEGVQNMFLARVLVGKTCVGNKSMRHPPQVIAGQPEVYDCLVDDAHHPRIFVSCHNDNQAYPEYMVSFRKRGCSQSVQTTGFQPVFAQASGVVAPRVSVSVRTVAVWNNCDVPVCIAISDPTGVVRATAAATSRKQIHPQKMETFQVKVGHTITIVFNLAAHGSDAPWTPVTVASSTHQNIILDRCDETTTGAAVALFAGDTEFHSVSFLSALAAELHSTRTSVLTAQDGTPLLNPDGSCITRNWPEDLAQKIENIHATYGRIRTRATAGVATGRLLLAAPLRRAPLPVSVKFCNQIAESVVVRCVSAEFRATIEAGAEKVFVTYIGQQWNAYWADPTVVGSAQVMLSTWTIPMVRMARQPWETAERVEHAIFVCGQ